MVGFVYAIAQAMGETTIPISAYFFLVPVGTVVQALPISPAGIGVGQAAFFFLFNHYLGAAQRNRAHVRHGYAGDQPSPGDSWVSTSI